MDMSHEAAKEAAFTIASQRRRVRGCRLVIHVPVSVTQGVNREEVVDSAELPFSALVFSPNKGGANVLDGPGRREAADGHKESHCASQSKRARRSCRFHENAGA